jgi:hypothetical protein
VRAEGNDSSREMSLERKPLASYLEHASVHSTKPAFPHAPRNGRIA